MPSIRPTALPLLVALLACATSAIAGDAPRVSGEPSRTPATKQAPAWRAPPPSAQAVARVRYGEMSAQRILRLQQANERRIGKPLQIGIAREAATESASSGSPTLHWTVLRDGSAVARDELFSPLAYGIRAGLDVSALDPRAELRVAGSARPDRVVAAVTGAQARARTGDDGLYWTPSTDGEAQSIEIWLPAGAAPALARLEAPRLSHLMTNAIEDFRILKNIGASDSCNIDTVCRVGELGQGFVNAKAAVARMTFMMD